MFSKGLMLAALAAGASCITPGNLRFKRTNGGSVVAQTQVLQGQVWTPADDDLAGARNTCVDELTMEAEIPTLAATRITPPPPTEIDLYGRHPNEMTAFLSGLKDSDILGGLAQFPTSNRSAWHPIAEIPSGFPLVPIAASSGAPPTNLALSTQQFFGARFATGLSTELSMCHPNGDAGLLQPGAALKSTTLFNRGSCRRELSLGDFLSSGNQLLVNALHEKKHLGVGSVSVSYSILQPFLSQTGTGLSEQVLGVFLFLHYVARDLAGNAPSHVVGAVRYEFVLDASGRVKLVPHELRWSYGGVWGPLSSEGAVGQPGWHGALTQADGAMVATVNKLILQKQLLGPQNGLVGAVLTSFECTEQTFLDQCGKAASTIGDTIGPAAGARSNASGGRLFTPDEVNHLRCAVGDAKGCDAIGRNTADVLRDRWVCTTSPISQAPYCDMVIPVRRLLPTPDSLGAVFFEGDDLDNAAYALQAGTSAVCEADKQLPASRSFPASVLRD